MNLVFTIAVGPAFQQIAKATHGTLRRYAQRIGADFLVIDAPKIATTTPHWEKFQIEQFLDTYDRVLYLDTDLIIRDDCPNLFEVVPEDALGMFNEAPFTDRSRELLIDVCKQYGIVLKEWNRRYYNSGVIVASKVHQPLFKKPLLEVCNFYEQTYLNMVIAYRQVKMFELEHQFNRMVCMDRVTGEERFASYIIHYAGFLFNTSLDRLLSLIPEDLRRWEQADGDYTYPHHVCINVNGGLGDQICAGPAIRYLREQLYPTDEVIVLTHWPRIFHHLTHLGVTVAAYGQANFKNDTPYFHVMSLPGPDTLQWRIVSHLLCHSVDYTAMALMKRTLPVKDRQIQFEVLPRDRQTLAKQINGFPAAGLVLVHPGRHWQSKTFPAAWWQAVIDGLVKRGERVALIGKDQLGDPPDFVEGARGTVDVTCPAGAIDLRNQLSLGELGALLAHAKVLVTNDSAPVHLAGAFDPHIVLIPSCKHPDHILPYRQGSQSYKATALYKRLILDDLESRPTQMYEVSADVPVPDWTPYLPEVEEVVVACGS